jgi:hypothetical protein
VLAAEVLDVLARAARDVENGPGVRMLGADQVGDALRLGRVVLERAINGVVDVSRLREQKPSY